MIVRIWHGTTKPEDAEEYERLVTEENYDRIEEASGDGYVGYEMAKRDDGDRVKYVTITRFDSWAAVEEFGGDDWERAFVPPKAQELLVEYDEYADHYEVAHDDGVDV